MPSLTVVVKRFTKQKMVYWPRLGADETGADVFGDPDELDVRWEDVTRQITTPDGRVILSTSYLLLSVNVIEGSLAFLGTINDWKALPTYPEIPTMNQGAKTIAMVKRTPDLKATGTVYEAFL